jgi:hypothetical protein
MKKTTLIKNVVMASLVLLSLISLDSCKKNDDPNVLTGDTNIPLTPVNAVTTVYTTVNGTSQPGSMSMTVLSNNNGTVTYGAAFDLNSYPDSVKLMLATILPQAISYYNPQNVTWNISASGQLNVQYTLKVTSEGMQNYFVDGKPWTVRYADGVGTKYTVTRTNGDVLTATVTEKTGVDDFPFGFLLIKTSKLEYLAPASDPVISKVTYRVNHKFGLVYLKVEGKAGRVLELSLFPYFLM